MTKGCFINGYLGDPFSQSVQKRSASEGSKAMALGDDIPPEMSVLRRLPFNLETSIWGQCYQTISAVMNMEHFSRI
jgi:hypothetical protein